MTTTQQPEVLRLAKKCADESQFNPDDYRWKAAEELYRLYSENAELQAGYNAAQIENERLKFACECYEKDIAAIAAALPAEKYDSKDWREGCTLERIQWLMLMYESAKDEIARLEDVIHKEPKK